MNVTIILTNLPKFPQLCNVCMPIAHLLHADLKKNSYERNLIAVFCSFVAAFFCFHYHKVHIEMYRF
jgi:hypothetical protein